MAAREPRADSMDMTAVNWPDYLEAGSDFTKPDVKFKLGWTSILAYMTDGGLLINRRVRSLNEELPLKCQSRWGAQIPVVLWFASRSETTKICEAWLLKSELTIDSQDENGEYLGLFVCFALIRR